MQDGQPAAQPPIAPAPGKPVHFGCTACGKCCDTPPIVTIGESFALMADFILAVQLSGPVADARLAADDPAAIAYMMTRAHLQALGAETMALRMGPMEQFETTLHVSATAIRAGEGDPCPKLADDGRCTIYERRPQRCRSVPFDYWLPEAATVAQGSQRLEAAVARGWLCDLSDTAPVVAEAGQLAPGAHRDAYLAGLAQMRRQNAPLGLLAAHFQQELTNSPEKIRGVVATLNSNGTLQYPYADMLEALHGFKRLHADPSVEMPDDPASLELLASLPSMEAFLLAQIPLIEAAIASNQQRQRSQDRAVTARLRALLGDYRKRLQG